MCGEGRRSFETKAVISSAKYDIDGIDFDVPFKIAVHNREENLEEEIDGVYQHLQ
jgi:hypothetical protein